MRRNCEEAKVEDSTRALGQNRTYKGSHGRYKGRVVDGVQEGSGETGTGDEIAGMIAKWPKEGI